MSVRRTLSSRAHPRIQTRVRVGPRVHVCTTSRVGPVHRVGPLRPLALHSPVPGRGVGVHHSHLPHLPPRPRRPTRGHPTELGPRKILNIQRVPGRIQHVCRAISRPGPGWTSRRRVRQCHHTRHVHWLPPPFLLHPGFSGGLA